MGEGGCLPLDDPFRTGTAKMKSLGNKADVAQRQRIARRQLSTDYREANVPPKLGVGMEGHIVWPQFGIPSSDREGATVGHSIARICGQVHEDLLDLSTISPG